ncbi:MAG: 50S ribosomal protein L6 [Elusimicrobiota bacterium]
MSRLAKKPIVLSDKVTAVLKDGLLEVKGPLGSLSQQIHPDAVLKIENKHIIVQRKGDSRQDKMIQGLTWALIRNMVAGVNQAFKKELEIRGVGFNVQLNGDELNMRLGFSHPVKFNLPQGITVTTDPKGILITVTGIDKQLVGETAARIRRIKPPEPYKGTGIRYVGEYVMKKAGKAAIGVGATGTAATGKK